MDVPNPNIRKKFCKFTQFSEFTTQCRTVHLHFLHVQDQLNKLQLKEDLYATKDFSTSLTRV